MDTQTIIPLTAKNFDEWFSASEVEDNYDGQYFVSTDSYNCVEVDTTSNGWTIKAAFPLSTNQIERILEAVHDFIRPAEEDEDHGKPYEEYDNQTQYR